MVGMGISETMAVLPGTVTNACIPFDAFSFQPTEFILNGLGNDRPNDSPHSALSRKQLTKEELSKHALPTRANPFSKPRIQIRV